MYFILFIQEYKKRMKIRKKVQEYPNKPLEDEFMDILYNNSEAIERL